LPPRLPRQLAEGGASTVGAAQARDLRSFGRRRGRRLSAHQVSLLEHVLPRVGLDLSSPCPPSLSALFAPTVSEVWLEIGFGGAEHLVWQAGQNPDIGLIGCEVFEDGVVKALADIEERCLANMRLAVEDARDVLRWLPEASLQRVFILFPDPWPKKRHVKRRLVSATLFGLLARVMAPGAELRIATDIGDYARTMLLAAREHPEFVWRARGPEDWRRRAADWPATRYEGKAIAEGRRCYFFSFRKMCP
jgi:tRNA (guanine-N7-)-methyltransferase